MNLSRDKDEVAIMFDHDDMIRIHVEAQQKSKTQNVIQSCGARIPHGPVALDMFVSGIMFFYAFLLVLLVAHVRKEWKYLRPGYTFKVGLYLNGCNIKAIHCRYNNYISPESL